MNPERSKNRVETDAFVRPAKAKSSGFLVSSVSFVVKFLFARDSRLRTHS
jgi:hypothetical protein